MITADWSDNGFGMEMGIVALNYKFFVLKLV